MRKPNITIILGKKLLAIRLFKKLSQGEMLALVIPNETGYNRSRVSQWEKGSREPPREAQIRYSRLAEITLEVLLDDNQELPAHIKKAGNSENRWSRRRRHKKSFNMNNTAREETSAATVEREPLPLAVPAISSQIGIDNLEVIAGNEIPGAEIKHYHPELMKLSLLNGEEPKERATFDLPADTLDQLDDMHLQVQLQMPRRARSSLTKDGMVNLGAAALLFNYHRYGDESLIVKQSLAISKRLNE